MSREELEELYNEILTEMRDLWVRKNQDTPEGVAKQKEIIRKINEHPEVLRIHSQKMFDDTIGTRAASYWLFYVTIRALEDNKAHEFRDKWGNNIFDLIKIFDTFRAQIINSQEYKDLVARLKSQVAEFDDEDMAEYDSIME